ncbi:methyltransferase [Auraticoccus sp. F435]|uniref:Methyltransferase n=1 Tax=Auraticoccus cholistanensis TaxID=2656650 RepID=A0A6A9UW06_9ACTN|nr:methyltransferase [Auraticoccus cholistanensis]
MSHYFETPEGPERRRDVAVEVWGRRWELQTANGVFAGQGLDLATGVLLRSHRPDPASRRLLDLGCGWGPIAIALAAELPRATVDAVDVNTRALGLCRDNAARAGVGDRVRVMTPEQVDADARYDEIWSNPPIRVGKEALHELLLQWLPRLTPTGVARLVVGRNLGADSLQRWLDERGHPCRRTASAKGFRVLEVSPAGG